MAKLFPTTLALEIPDYQVVNDAELQEILNEIAKAPKDILTSQKTLKSFIETGLGLTKVLKDGTTNDKIEQAIVPLFNLITQLRTYLTGEVYLLNVQMEDGTVVEGNLGNLFTEGLIFFNNGQVEYKLQDLKKQLDEIKIHRRLYNALTNRLFRQTLNKTKSYFVYRHSDNTVNVGYFFDQHFAHYITDDNSLVHYFVKTKQREYYSKTAKYYNRGHVYEWYIDDLNNIGYEKMKNTANDPVSFMERHERDTVPFLKQGDVTRERHKTIEAIQVKRFNNTKLITCQQLETTLKSLNNLTSSRLTEEKVKKVIMETFTPINYQGQKIRQETIDHIEKASDILFENWKNIHGVTF